jgi:hypothetical protein
MSAAKNIGACVRARLLNRARIGIDKVDFNLTDGRRVRYAIRTLAQRRVRFRFSMIAARTQSCKVKTEQQRTCLKGRPGQDLIIPALVLQQIHT